MVVGGLPFAVVDRPSPQVIFSLPREALSTDVFSVMTAKVRGYSSNSHSNATALVILNVIRSAAPGVCSRTDQLLASWNGADSQRCWRGDS
jgi:hypothetical protein